MHLKDIYINIKNKTLFFYIQWIIVLFLNLKINAFAQIQAKAEVDKNEIRIGEPIELKLLYIIPDELSSYPFVIPTFKDTITKQIEIIEYLKTDTVHPSNQTIIQQKIKISAYDSGQFVLPSIRFYSKIDSTKFALTNTLLITVHTVPTDTSETSLKDIKPIFEEPFDIKWYFPIIIKLLIALLIVSIIIYLIYYYTRRKKKETLPEKPKLPPHIIALEKLNQIKASAIWKEGKIKVYYSSVADTIREYIEGRYGIPALEQTSFETLQALKFKAIDPATREKLKSVFELADMVKFAKLLPVESDHYLILENAFDIVNQTKEEYTSNHSNHPIQLQNNQQ